MESICALGSVSLYLVRYVLLCDVSVSQIRLILFLTDFTIQVCCAQNVPVLLTRVIIFLPQVCLVKHRISTW